MTDRLITLTVGTKEAEEWFRTFQDLSELAANMSTAHDYVTISSFVAGEEEESASETDSLTYDDHTLEKFYEAIRRTITLATNQEISNAVTELQNAGIFLRERR